MQVTDSLINLSYQFGKYFTERDAKGLSNLMHENFSLYDPALSWVRGRDKVIEVLQKGFDESKIISYEIKEAFKDGDTTILRFEIIMDERKFIGVDFMRWQDEKMTELICYYNPLKQ